MNNGRAMIARSLTGYAAMLELHWTSGAGLSPEACRILAAQVRDLAQRAEVLEARPILAASRHGVALTLLDRGRIVRGRGK